MKALLVHGPGSFEIVERPYPQPQENEVTIRLKKCRLSKRELNSPHRTEVRYPIIPGVEFSGVIEELGSGANGLRRGDHIAVIPYLSCGQCKCCTSNHEGLCPYTNLMGMDIDGGLAEYVVLPHKNVITLPSTISMIEATLVRSVASVIHTIRITKVHVGARVLIFGTGIMAQLLAQACILTCCSEVVVVGESSNQLDVMKVCGATQTVLSTLFEDELASCKGDKGFDIVIDTTGNQQLIQRQFQYIQPRGYHVQLSMTRIRELYLNIVNPSYEFMVINSRPSYREYKSALKWLMSGVFNINHLTLRDVLFEEILLELSNCSTSLEDLVVNFKPS